MLADELSHLEHVDCLLAKYLSELIIGDDVSFVVRVLSAVFLNVFPDFLCNFCTWHWAFTDDCSEVFAHLHRLHEF